MTKLRLLVCLALALVAASSPVVAQVETPGFNDDDDSFDGFVGNADEDTEVEETDDTESGSSGFDSYTERVLVNDDFNGPGCAAPATRLATWEVRTVWGPGPDDWTLQGWEHLCSDDSTVFYPYSPPGGAVGGGRLLSPPRRRRTWWCTPPSATSSRRLRFAWPRTSSA